MGWLYPSILHYIPIYYSCIHICKRQLASSSSISHHLNKKKFTQKEVKKRSQMRENWERLEGYVPPRTILHHIRPGARFEASFGRMPWTGNKVVVSISREKQRGG